jgi:hypothetical protein
MDFEYSAKTKELQKRVKAFMDDHIYPAEPSTAPSWPPTRPRASAGRR